MSSQPVVLVPGLIASARYYAAQIPALWGFGPVTVANHTGGDSIGAIARDILAAAPPRFALAGHSMGGYIAFEILRQAPQRVTRLALLDTSAWPDTPEQTVRRRQQQIAATESGRFDEIPDQQYPSFVHAERTGDGALRAVMRAMAEDCGAHVFVRQQKAIMARADSRPTLAAIRCATRVIVGDSDQPTPPVRAQEIAQAIAGATLTTIARCGHMSAIERPQEVNAALCEWMQT